MLHDLSVHWRLLLYRVRLDLWGAAGISAYILRHRFSVTRFWDEVRNSRATAVNYVGETCRYLLVIWEKSNDC